MHGSNFFDKENTAFISCEVSPTYFRNRLEGVIEIIGTFTRLQKDLAKLDFPHPELEKI